MDFRSMPGFDDPTERPVTKPVSNPAPPEAADVPPEKVPNAESSKVEAVAGTGGDDPHVSPDVGVLGDFTALAGVGGTPADGSEVAAAAGLAGAADSDPVDRRASVPGGEGGGEGGGGQLEQIGVGVERPVPRRVQRFGGGFGCDSRDSVGAGGPTNPATADGSRHETAELEGGLEGELRESFRKRKRTAGDAGSGSFLGSGASPAAGERPGPDAQSPRRAGSDGSRDASFVAGIDLSGTGREGAVQRRLTWDHISDFRNCPRQAHWRHACPPTAAQMGSVESDPGALAKRDTVVNVFLNWVREGRWSDSPMTLEAWLRRELYQEAVRQESKAKSLGPCDVAASAIFERVFAGTLAHLTQLGTFAAAGWTFKAAIPQDAVEQGPEGWAQHAAPTLFAVDCEGAYSLVEVRATKHPYAAKTEDQRVLFQARIFASAGYKLAREHHHLFPAIPRWDRVQWDSSNAVAKAMSLVDNSLASIRAGVQHTTPSSGRCRHCEFWRICDVSIRPEKPQWPLPRFQRTNMTIIMPDDPDPEVF